MSVIYDSFTFEVELFSDFMTFNNETMFYNYNL